LIVRSPDGILVLRVKAHIRRGDGFIIDAKTAASRRLHEVTERGDRLRIPVIEAFSMDDGTEPPDEAFVTEDLVLKCTKRWEEESGFFGSNDDTLHVETPPGFVFGALPDGVRYYLLHVSGVESSDGENVGFDDDRGPDSRLAARDDPGGTTRVHRTRDCPECGSELTRTGASFCPDCGARLPE
jgi:hypothetical protein